MTFKLDSRKIHLVNSWNSVCILRRYVISEQRPEQTLCRNQNSLHFPFSTFLEKFIPISLDSNNDIIKYLKSFSQSYLKVYKEQMKIKIKIKDKVPMEIYLNDKIDMHSIKKNRNNFLQDTG